MKTIFGNIISRGLRPSILMLCLPLAACLHGSDDNDSEPTAEAAAPPLAQGQTPPSATPKPSRNASEVTFFTDPGNPLMLSYKPENGKKTFLIGKRSEDGTAFALDSMYFDDGTERPNYLTLDSTGRPSVMKLSDGSTLTYQYLDKTHFNVVVRTPNGIETTVPIDLANPAGAAQQRSLRSVQSPLSTTVLTHTSVAHNPATAATLNVSVTSQTNGTAVSGATVWANILSRKPGSGNGYKVPLTEAGGGKYTGQFVNTPSTITPDTIEPKCNTVVENAQDYCSFGAPIAEGMAVGGCIAVGALTSLIATPAIGAAVGFACESAAADAVVACGAIAVTPGEAVPAICRGIQSTVSIFDPDGARITATASKSGKIASAAQDVAGRAREVSIAVQLPLSTARVDFDSDFTGGADGVHRSHINATVSEGLPGDTVTLVASWGGSQATTLDANGTGSFKVNTPDHEGCFNGNVKITLAGQDIGQLADDCF